MEVDILEYRVFMDGEKLFEKGDRGSEAYLIIDGQVRIVNYNEKNDEEIGIRGPSDIVGEMAIISNEPRMAMASAIGETHCYAIQRRFMEKIIDFADLETRSLIHFLIGFLRDLHLKFRGEEIDLAPEDEETNVSQKQWSKNILIARRLLESGETEAQLQDIEPILQKLCRALLKRVGEKLADLETTSTD